MSSLDGVLILQEGFTFPHVISAVERSEQVWWVSLGYLFFPILSELKVIRALWKRCGNCCAKHGTQSSGIRCPNVVGLVTLSGELAL